MCFNILMQTDLYIAQHANLKPIHEIAEQLELTSDDLDIYGSPHIAKLRLDVLEKTKTRPNAKYIDISAITPTPLGEGKSTTLIGLGEAMKHLGRRAVVSLRQPSQGPTFGIKGGAAGGGYAQVVPMESFNRKEFPDSLLRGFLISPVRATDFVLKKFVVFAALGEKFSGEYPVSSAAG
jgi:formate--tetrahydrofolate ligase